MTIKIKIPPRTEKKEPDASIRLEIKKTIDGNLLINDHEYIDILVVPKENKIVTMAKPYADRDVYDYQHDLLYSLFQGGVTDSEAPRGAGRFGMIEVKYPKSSEVNSLQAVLYQLSEYIKKSSRDEIVGDEYDQNIEDRFTDPGPEDSTKYGEFPPVQDTPAGQQVIEPAYSFAGYGYLY
tara:strand:- start:358 stop:897 length:540 start_codon:yes stop_codon:yes gene_type:complete